MKQKLTEEYFINKWLNDYFDTDLAGVLKSHPEWDVEAEDWESRMFYEAYQVTEKQHDEWHEWAIKEIKRAKRVGRKVAEKMFALPYLNVAPMVKKD